MNTRDNKQKIGDQKTIFDYVVDNSMYVNNSQCFNSTPPFISYIPIGVPNKNVDIENELRGSNRQLTKCNENKYIPVDLNTVQKIDDKQTQYTECNDQNKIIRKYINN